MKAALDRLAARALGIPVRRTERLLIRPWREGDREPFAAINADSDVMRYFPTALSRQESDALIDRFRVEAARRGFGIAAVEERATNTLIGMMGVWVPEWEAAFTPTVEMAWRLARVHGGKGFATEAANDTLRYAFETLRLPELMAWTVPANERSWKLMERIGMTRAGTFEHPRLAEGHPLREHVRYVIRNPVSAPAELVAVEPVSAQAEPLASERAAASLSAANPERAPKSAAPKVWIDGDGCPRVIKEIVWKAAQRGVIDVTMVANREIMVPRSVRIRTVVVAKGLDVADDWLVAHAGAGELVITSDIPLAAELVAKKVEVVSPRGEWFTPVNIGEKLSLRDFFTEARASGMIEGGGPAGFDERAKRLFANGLDQWISRQKSAPARP